MMNNKNIKREGLKPALAILTLLTASLYSGHVLAGVFKCSDGEGNTVYQSAPCTKEFNTVQINIKTGSQTDISAKEKEIEDKKSVESELEKKQAIEAQKLADLETKRKKDAAEQSALNQQLIKNNPIQFSAFAIPPYHADKLPGLVKKFESRLPEIEKFRRLAALKALATGDCKRVEADNLSVKSRPNSLVFAIDCSSAKTFHFNEADLLE